MDESNRRSSCLYTFIRPLDSIISLPTHYGKNILLYSYIFLAFLHLSIYNCVLLQVLCDTPSLFRVPRWCTH